MQTTANDEIKIRTATPEDAEALAAIYAPYVENTSFYCCGSCICGGSIFLEYLADKNDF